MTRETLEFAKRLVVENIWRSSNLEGLGTTFSKTEAILDNIPTETKREEVVFIINMKRAWDFLLQNTDYPNCIMLLREYNKIVGENLFYRNGEIGNSNVSTGKSSVVIEKEVHEKIKGLEQIKDIETRALKYFCYVSRAKIFVDGNKRVAQLITNKILLENNIGILQIPINSMEEFKSLLLRYYESGNDGEIINFMKEYCINRINGDIRKQYKKEVGTGFVDVKIESKFEMSKSGVKVFNSALYNLRRLLNSKGITEAELYLDGDNVKLAFNNSKYILYSGNSTLDKFIYKTVELLVDNVPLPLKRVNFYVSDSSLVGGRFSKLKDENGSVDIKLW